MTRIAPLCFLLLVTACATATPLQGSREVPAARGTVDFKEGDNGNTQLDIKVEHLASPSELRGGDSTYVVWVQGYGERQRRASQQNSGWGRISAGAEGPGSHPRDRARVG